MKPLIIDAFRVDRGLLTKVVSERARECMGAARSLDPLTRLLEYIRDEMNDQYPEDES